MEKIKELEKLDKEKKEKIIFWVRALIWLIFALIIPLTFICYKFKLFQTTTTTKVAFGGRGIIAIIILFFFIKALIGYVKKGLPYSMTTQCLDGFVKVVLPLLAIILIGYIMLTTFKDGLSPFLITMGVILGCEIVAIPVNPFPKWIYESNKKRRQDEATEVGQSLIQDFMNEFFKKKDDTDKK